MFWLLWRYWYYTLLDFVFSDLACLYGNRECAEKAKKNFASYPVEPDRDQKLTTYCYGIQEGTTEDWDKLWDQFKKEDNANEEYALRYGMACSKDTAVLKKYLENAIGPDVRVQAKSLNLK